MVTLYDVDVETPRSLEDALEKMEATRFRVIAGGTDVIIQLKEGTLREKKLLNIYSLGELRYIRQERENLCIGPLTTLSEIAASREINEFAPMLAQAAEKIGSIQITNKATIGGNIGNASPSGDCIPPLYALDARIVVKGKGSKREIHIEDFFTGYKEFDLRPNELITEITFKKMTQEEDSIFAKHTLRLGEACSVVSVAIWINRGNRRAEIVDARIALGGLAPTVVRAHKSEKLVKHELLDQNRITIASEAVTSSISPISDVRGTSDYRREMAVNLTGSCLYELLARSQENR